MAGVSEIQPGTPLGRSLVMALAAGTAVGTDIVIEGIDANDELVAVMSFATAAAIETVADRTAEYTIHEGGLGKAAGTDETNNQLVVFYWHIG